MEDTFVKCLLDITTITIVVILIIAFYIKRF